MPQFATCRNQVKFAMFTVRSNETVLQLCNSAKGPGRSNARYTSLLKPCLHAGHNK